MSRLFAIDNVVDSDDWYTPAWIFDGLGLTFDLDVAAPDGGPPNVPAQSFYTVADDGLLSPWFGTVWCNPPYSAPTLWCRKWAQHDAGCILIRSDLSTSGPFVAFSAAHAAYVPPQAPPVHVRRRQGHGSRQLLHDHARARRTRRAGHAQPRCEVRRRDSRVRYRGHAFPSSASQHAFARIG